MISGKTIFISPVDWGLGHATRCIPIIAELSVKNEIIIGVTDLNRFFFEHYFPNLKKINVPSYGIRYSKRIPLWIKLVLQWPKINAAIRREKRSLEKIISDFKIDLIISDNRFGLTNKNVQTIFVTHQLQIKVPVFSAIANRVNKKYIHQFDEVWVPDYEDVNLRLSGQLSDSAAIKIPVRYIGPKTALSIFLDANKKDENIDYLILLSGVEPQRTFLETSLVNKFAFSEKKIVLVRGSNTPLLFKPGNIKIIDVVFGEELRCLLVNAKTVICRSGYSTLMDLNFLNKKDLILIPTPGQTEQEYLAEYWERKFHARKIAQNKIADSKF